MHATKLISDLICIDVRVTRALAKAIVAQGGTVAPEQDDLRSPCRSDGMRVVLPVGSYLILVGEYSRTVHLPDGQCIAGESGGARALYLKNAPLHRHHAGDRRLFGRAHAQGSQMKPSLLGVEPLMPAYGRDYQSEAALLADFNANKDFATPSGAYTSKQDLADMGVTTIKARYKRLTAFVVLKVTP